MEQIKITAKDVTFNKNVAAAKVNWFCENYQNIITGLETAKLFFKNPFVKMLINLSISAVTIVAQTICAQNKKKK